MPTKKTSPTRTRAPKKPSFTVRAIAESAAQNALLAGQDIVAIARNLRHFPEIDVRELASALLRDGKGFEVVFNFGAFERRGVDRAALRRMLRGYLFSPGFLRRALAFGMTGEDNPLEGIDEVQRFLAEEEG